jgi:DNA-damage-inducible protein D
MQAVFHDQRYLGLYDGHSAAAVKRMKGLDDDTNFFDHAGPLELSAHDFQMNLAANVISREGVTGAQNLIRKNFDVAKEVRKAIDKSGATMPEKLPLAKEPIQAVQKRIRSAQKKLPKNSPNAS